MEPTITVVLSAFVIELSAPVRVESGVLPVALLSVPVTELTAPVRGSTMPRVFALPLTPVLIELVTELSAPVSGASGVLLVALLSVEPTVLTVDVTGGTMPTPRAPPLMAVLSEPMMELTELVTGASGVLLVALLRSEPMLLSVEVTGDSAPCPGPLPLTMVLSVPVVELSALVSGASGVPDVACSTDAPMELTEDVTG